MTETLSKSFTVNIVHLQNQQFQLWDSHELKDRLPPQRTMSKKNVFPLYHCAFSLSGPDYSSSFAVYGGSESSRISLKTS